jgi:hypothetical protein
MANQGRGGLDKDRESCKCVVSLGRLGRREAAGGEPTLGSSGLDLDAVDVGFPVNGHREVFLDAG